jgi:Alw26I/Eco31I/Esp3I family type II restriction m6 adenine DNA methyltransferase
MFDAHRTASETKRLRISEAELAAENFALPIVFGVLPSGLRSKFSSFPSFCDLEGNFVNSLWAGRELDETRIKEKVVRGMRHPFVKGRMIQRHQILGSPEFSVRANLASNFISSKFERIAWRDVSRASQSRRMITAIIPAGWVAGNSLHLAHFRDGDPKRLRALYAILSSYVFEFQVRNRLATGHMSLGIIRSTKIPALSARVVASLGAHATRVLAGSPSTRLEVAVAKAYGLSRDDFADVLSFFSAVKVEEKDKVLKPALWSHQ